MIKDDVLFGTWAEIPSAYVTDIIAKAGMDFLIIDMEHGVIGFELAQNMVFAAHNEGRSAYIRVPSAEETWVLRALDTGCDGIVVPQVTDVDTVKKVIRYAYFAPEGFRGFNPYIAAGGYAGGDRGYFIRENKRIKLIVILEGRIAFEHIEEICRFSEIDAVYIGQYDLSVDLGVPGDVESPMVLKTMKKAVGTIREYEKMAGCMVQDAQDAKRYIQMGFNFIVYKVDSGVLFQSMKDFVEGANGNEGI